MNLKEAEEILKNWNSYNDEILLGEAKGFLEGIEEERKRTEILVTSLLGISVTGDGIKEGWVDYRNCYEIMKHTALEALEAYKAQREEK